MRRRNSAGVFQRFDSTILHKLSRQISWTNNRESFNSALVQCAGFGFILFFIFCGWFVYRVLEPFLQSILWSILAGAFLFPFKRRLTNASHQFLKDIDDHSHFLVYGLFVLFPLRVIDQTIESIGQFCITSWKRIVLVLLFLPSIQFINSGIISHWLSIISFDLYEKFFTVVHQFDKPWANAVVLAYLIAVFFLYERYAIVKIFLNIFSLPFWFGLLVYLSKYLPTTYRLIVISLIIASTFVGLLVNIQEYFSEKRQKKSKNIGVARTNSKSDENPSLLSTSYFNFVLWSLFALKIYQFGWYFLPLPIFVLVYKIIKFSLISIYEWLMKQKKIGNFLQEIKKFFQKRRTAFAPSPLVGLLGIVVKGDKNFNRIARYSIDYLISALMIVGLLIVSLFGTAILIIQIRHESLHMMKLMTNLVNETPILEPLFKSLSIDREHLGDILDRALNNFYVTGRSWIVKKINNLTIESGSNPELEEEAVHAWDRFFTYVTNTSTLIFTFENQTKFMSIEEKIFAPTFFDEIVKIFHFGFNDLYRLFHDNIELLQTVFGAILSNGTIFVKFTSMIFSILFNGSFALLNFFVSFFVFVTLLFYLLSVSNETSYRPNEWLNNILTIGNESFGQAVNEAVTSVFVASLKIAAFYGLYTYVLHSLIGSNLLFLPAVIGSVCAVILKSYWAALPGFLDLWLVQQRPLAAFLLILGQIVPVYIVDTAIYSEVKDGGHQYLTALAIAGGVYYRGIEGALIGPIVFCCLLVAFRLYNETMTRTFSSTKNIDSENSFKPVRRINSFPQMNNFKSNERRKKT